MPTDHPPDDQNQPDPTPGGRRDRPTGRGAGGDRVSGRRSDGGNRNRPTDEASPDGRRTLRPDALHPAGLTSGPTWGDFSPGDETTDLDEVQRTVGPRYRIDRLAGSGGMSQVFAATDLEQNRRVAIKFLRVGRDDDALDARKRTRRLIAEARAMAQLRHPGLCRVLEVKMDAERAFIVMTWIDGTDLRAFVKDRSQAERLSIFLKIADAVTAIHAEGIIHGDLKPGNVLVTADGSPMLVDFGLAVTELDSAGLGAMGGTPGYAAPEQFDSASPVGPPADVFALGVILFELLTDQLPFGPGSTAKILEEMRRLDPPLPRAIRPAIPAGVQRVCLAALGHDATTRYADAGSMLADLRRTLRGEAPLARPAGLFASFANDLDAARMRTAYWSQLGMIAPDRAKQTMRALEHAAGPGANRAASARGRPDAVAMALGAVFLGGGFAIGTIATPPGAARVAGVVLSALLAIAATVVALRPRIDTKARAWRSALAGPASSLAVGFWTVLVWQILRAGGWLSPFASGAPGGEASGGAAADGTGDAVGQWAVSELALRLGPAFAGGPPFDVVPRGASNAELFATALAGSLIAFVFRWLSPAAGPRVLLAVLFALAWAGLYPLTGRLAQPAALAGAEFGLWMSLLGATLLLPAIGLDRTEQRRRVARPDLPEHASDATPWMTLAILLVGSGLSLLAWLRPAWVWAWVGDIDTAGTGPGARAFAFTVNGAVLLLLAWLLGHRNTALRTHWGTVLRIAAPLHWVVASITLAFADAGPAGWVSLVIALIVCLLLSLAGARPGWRLSGAVGIAGAFACAAGLMVRGALAGWPVAVLASGVALLGAGLLTLAWCIPGQREQRALRGGQHPERANGRD